MPFIALVALTLTVQGGITFYYGPQFENQPLKCPGYTYSPETGPWLAVDIGWYESGAVHCGDLFLVHFKDGTHVYARALDSGYLAKHNVFDTGLPFVADLPIYWRDGRKTGTGWVLNVSAGLRGMKDRENDVP